MDERHTIRKESIISYVVNLTSIHTSVQEILRSDLENCYESSVSHIMNDLGCIKTGAFYISPRVTHESISYNEQKSKILNKIKQPKG